MLRQNLRYETHDGQTHKAVISIAAEMAWEHRTGKSWGEAFNPPNVTMIVGMLCEQLRIDGTLPEGVSTAVELAPHLADVSLSETDVTTVPPTVPTGHAAT